MSDAIIEHSKNCDKCTRIIESDELNDIHKWKMIEQCYADALVGNL